MSLLGLAVLAMMIIACGGGGEDSGIEIRPAEGVVGEAGTATAENGETRTTTQRAVEASVRSGRDLSESDLSDFVEQFGYPSDATFARVRIPVLGVDAAVASRFVDETGVMPLPGGPADVAWYDLSAWPGMGGAPGEGRNAVFAGHVDYADYVPYADADYRGKGVFQSLDQLAPGDIIEVEYQGTTLRYAVVWNKQLSASPDATDWGAVWSDQVSVESITLYTCGGDFDPITRTYNDRTVVRAERLA